jgi:hypothetical protein
VKSEDRSTLSHTVASRTNTDAPCRNRTYNLMIKSQILADLTPEGTPPSPSYSSASLVQQSHPKVRRSSTLSHTHPQRLKPLLFRECERLELHTKETQK